ncbi:PepSY domain-containing protein [Bradyrhizobium daqingense]|uniref:Putative iron-regulated membrane protein n=1 Tax=Bradyrhizobium daqingense TaxID=993502 RepID=A0A562LVA2_9BRAD|nr:PepSY domain-containing protein [Bradyrhizobium daqingense]TWI11448.1 putative iron-regulated membrane protein [Bradyrhizobium daqingense]UFS92264.1 PepSY domain-containing protein [Bradyrhizobium daqingense]
MSARRLRWWSWIHKWSSLICTIFALLLCLTGLPLIFHEELGPNPTLEQVADPRARASVDAMIAQALAERPGEIVPYLFYDREKPIVKIPTATSMTSAPDTFFYKVFDIRTGKALTTGQPNEGFIYVMLRLHADLFAGIKGTLFLGGMGLLLVVAIVSGVVLYGPFARRLGFGEVRRQHSSRLRWLDLHNLLGIITLAWFGIVSLTGVINTLAAPIELMWQSNQLMEMAVQSQAREHGDRRASVDLVLAKVRAAVPGMTVTTLAFPGSPFSTPSHYAAFLTGNTPLTSRILKPAIIDAASGEVVAVRDMPWYATALFVSQPLHFGDYGGLPLKIIWAAFDIVTIVILISGLYLWLARWRAGGAIPAGTRTAPAELVR